MFISSPGLRSSRQASTNNDVSNSIFWSHGQNMSANNITSVSGELSRTLLSHCFLRQVSNPAGTRISNTTRLHRSWSFEPRPARSASVLPCSTSYMQGCPCFMNAPPLKLNTCMMCRIPVVQETSLRRHSMQGLRRVTKFSCEIMCCISYPRFCFRLGAQQFATSPAAREASARKITGAGRKLHYSGD
jgi:hypothetical protein